jgi:hypothetical protein
MKTADVPRPVELDTLLTLEEAAALWRLRPEELSAKSKGRNAKIPGIWLNARVVRFHPRMMFAKVARDNGVPMDVIMSALNVRPADSVSLSAQGPGPAPGLGTAREPVSVASVPVQHHVCFERYAVATACSGWTARALVALRLMTAAKLRILFDRFGDGRIANHSAAASGFTRRR